MKTKNLILIALIICAGCSDKPSRKSLADDFSDTFQKTSQAHFALGVETAYNILLKRALAGESIIVTNLYELSVAQDIERSKGRSTLKMP